MERVTISLDERLLDDFDRYIARKGYANRSEAIRDLLRERLEADRLSTDAGAHVVGCLSYVFNHHQRELSQRLTRAQHENHDLVRSTLHVHLDHDNCLEVAVIEGRAAEVRGFAEATIAETGVRHGNLHLVPTEMARGTHRHGGHADPHTHMSPKT
jgi:CopG family transcriptional regulator, nickel-responsive regulator